MSTKRALGKEILLKDYQPTPYLITQARLTFRLAPKATRVSARLSFAPNPKAARRAPIVLDGEKVKLVSIAIDGQALNARDYKVDAQSLTWLRPPRGTFDLMVETECDPSANTELTGLYLSNGIYCTQCEAEGFRRITYFYDRPDVLGRFHVRVEAPQSLPVLLSNGNPKKAGKLDDGWHYAEWDDPHPKPSYLFALVAGDLAKVSSRFVTATGRKVKLGIYVERGKEDRCAWAMQSLKTAMRWDETAFKRHYDLDVFNIVAVPDFNMGAMENKGLNIFNDKYILATPESATDLDFELIEGIIAHEYFHNWTGNRITCRDWFQLCLKEGLTVFRDQEFTSDVRSRAVKRIEDVQDLRIRQVPEDEGPLQHPPRPNSYVEINNFYTATVYDKGAEICRMLQRLIGKTAFAKGMQLYFKRHDGEAATVEQFVRCFEDSSQRDLSQFLRWYTQGGAPHVFVKEKYDAKRKRYTISLKQHVKRLNGQPRKLPLVIPLDVALIGAGGREMKLPQRALEFSKASQNFIFENVKEKPVLSFNRGFAAPLIVERDVPSDELLFLLAHDADRFNRWEAGQQLCGDLILSHYADGATRAWNALVVQYAGAITKALRDRKLEPAYQARLLQGPALETLAARIGKHVDAGRLQQAADAFWHALAVNCGAALQRKFAATKDSGRYAPTAAANGRRSLRAALLHLGAQGEQDWCKAALQDEFAAARNFTSAYAALSTANIKESKPGADMLTSFYQRHGKDPLLIDKWFAVQARIPGEDAAARVRKLMAHEAFTLKTPNRVYSLLGTFVSGNFSGFHAASGAGYELAADAVLKLDAINPQVASRLAKGFRSWRLFDVSRRAAAQKCMQRILAHKSLSKDVSEIISRTLAV